MKNPRGFVIIILVVVILAAAVHIDRFLHNTSVDGTSKSKEPDYISFDNGEKNTIDNKNPLIVIDDNDKGIEATSSSTGILFKNKKIRSYDGNKNRFFYGQLSSNLDVQKLTNDCQRWGVVTTIFDPNEAIVRVATLPFWCLVIVPDNKTPHNYMQKLHTLMPNNDSQDSSLSSKYLDNVFYLSIEQQLE